MEDFGFFGDAALTDPYDYGDPFIEWNEANDYDYEDSYEDDLYGYDDYDEYGDYEPSPYDGTYSEV